VKTLILGLGNPILSDDGVGFRVAEELKGRLNKQVITVREASAAGLDLLDWLAIIEPSSLMLLRLKRERLVRFIGLSLENLRLPSMLPHLMM